MPFPAGKVLGGSSAINGMLYIRGPGRGLRRLARCRQRGLGLGRRAPLLPQGRGPAARRERESRHGRAHRRERHAAEQPRFAPLPGGRSGEQHPAPGRPQRRRPARHRAGPGHDPQGPAHDHRGGVSQAGGGAGQPAHRDRGSGGPHRGGGGRSHRRGLSRQVRRQHHGLRRARGGARRRRGGLAPAAAAVGDRRCGAARGARHRAGAPPAGGRGEPARPSLRLRPAPAEEGGADAQPAAGEPAADRAGGAALRPHAHRRARAHLLRGLRLSRFKRAGRPARHRDHLPPRSASTCCRAAAGARIPSPAAPARSAPPGRRAGAG